MATSIKRGDPQSEKIKYIKGTFFVIRPDETAKEPFWVAYALEDVPAKNKEVYVRWLTVSNDDETEYKVSPESSSSNIPVESIIVTTVLKPNSKQESTFKFSKTELKRVNTIVENESSEEDDDEEDNEENEDSSSSSSEEEEEEEEVKKKPTKKQLVQEKKKEEAAAKKLKEKEKEKAKKLKEKEKEKEKAKKLKEKEKAKEKAKKLKEKEKEKEKEKKSKSSSKKSTKKDESSSESESESGESESESEKETTSKKSSTKKTTTTTTTKKQPIKKLVSPKKSKKVESESSSSSSESEAESSSSSSSESESDSEAEKKKKKKKAATTVKKEEKKKVTGKRKKDEESDASSGDEEEEEEDKATKKKSKVKGGESKKTATTKAPKVVKPTKATLKAQTKKGNANPSIPAIENDPLLEWAKTATKLSDYCCAICRSRDASRAIIVNNMPLLKEVIQENRYNSLLSTWSDSIEKSPLSYAVLSNNIEAIQIIYKALLDKTRVAPSLPSFEKASTGSYSNYTYGHRVRQLTQSRGGKEGDEAFLHDSENYSTSELDIDAKRPEIYSLLFSNNCVKLSTIQEVFKLDTAMNDDVANHIFIAARAGNLEVTEYFVKDFFKRGGFGFNIVHQEALGSSGDDFTPFKSVSVTKKPNFGNVTPIHFAAINPKGKYLKALLDVLPESSRPDHNAFRPIHYAAACTLPINVNLLVGKGVELNDLNSVGQTPLMIAASLGRVQNIKALAKAAKDRSIVNFVKTKNKKLQDALHFAAEAGQVGSIRALLEEGADIDVAEKGTKYNALMKASIMGHLDAVKVLVEEGKSDIEKKDKFKRTAVMLAAINGHTQIVSYLLHYNASLKVIDTSKNSILHYTSAYGWVDVTRYLVENFGQNINEFNDWKTTPLSIAIRKGHFQTTKFLLDKNADANVTDEDNKSILLQSLGNSSLSLSLMDNLKYLIIQGKANVNHVDKDQNGVLHSLALASIEIPKELAPPPVQRNYYFYNSQQRQQQETQQDPEIVEKRLAEQLKIFKEIASFLIEKGANLNVKNKQGITPLMLAFQEKNVAAIIYFLTECKDISLIGTYSSTKSNILHDIMKLQDNPHFTKITELLLTKTKDLKTLIDSYNKEHITPIMSIIKNYKASTKPEVESNFNKFLRDLITSTKPDLTLVEEVQVAGDHEAMDTSVNHDDDSEDDENMNSEDDDGSNYDGSDDGSDYDGSDNDDDDEKEDSSTTNVELILKRTALHFAVMSGSQSIVSILLEFKPKNIDPLNVFNETPLHIAIENNHFAIASLFIDNGANLKISNTFERTPLHLACAKMNFPLIKKLTIKNSPINKQDYKGLTPLMIACQNKGNISDEALEGEDNPISILLQNGADPKIVDSKKRNALHYSINASGADANSSFEIEDLLLKHSVPLNGVDYLGRTPLHYAFIKIGSSHIQNNTSYDPVQVVSSLCSFESIEIDKPDKFGRTPLFYACQHGSTVSALLLIQRKADINRVDEDGNSPLATTLLFKHPDCAINIIQKGANVKTTLTKFTYKVSKHTVPFKSSSSSATTNGTTTTSATTASTATTPKTATATPTIPLDKQPTKVEYTVTKENVEKVGLFYHVVSNNWQGVAYIMLDSGLDNFSALRDAFKADKYQLALTLLSKVRSATELQHASPDLKQNLFHFIGMYPSSVANWSARVQQKLLTSGVSPNLADSTGKTPLHYSSISDNLPFTQFLIAQKLNINQQDKEGHTPFTLSLIKIKQPITVNSGSVTPPKLPTQFTYLLSNQPNLELKFKAEDDNMITPLIYAITIRHPTLISTLLTSKANVNTVDALGQPPIFYAVKSNKMDIVNLLLAKKPNLNIQDADKKSVVHCVVNPIEYGSFENVELLKVLVKAGAKIDLTDIAGKTPSYYASLQDSGKMKAALLALGAKKIAPESIPTREVSTISNWANNTINYEQDYAKYIESKKELMAASNKTLKPVVDPISGMSNNSEVYVDSESGLIYDILMTKVDVKYGRYGENNFYKMQVIYNSGIDRYFLWNRWGRIGDSGQYQKTPFSKEEALAEFCKIFKTKSGNAFSSATITNFQKIQGRYHLVHIDRTDKSKKEILHPFNLSQYPKSQLPKDLYDVMAQFCNVEAISAQLKSLKIDTDVMPLGRISKDLINKAIVVLGKLNETVEQIRLIEEHEENKKKASLSNDDNATNANGGEKNAEDPHLPSLNDVLENQIKLSNEFYELIPHSNFTTDKMTILKNAKEITAKTTLLQSLDELETVAKILIAAHQNTQMHPYDYCSKAIGASLEKIDVNSPEYTIIKKYSENTGCTNKVVNIFKLQRKGEVERFQAHKNLKNHYLLWHGSTTTNYLSILSQGLKIAPPEAPVTGYMFGKGVYFADMFRKSINYCGHGWYGGSGSGPKHNFLLLSEVALGNMAEFKEAHYMESPVTGTNSTKGVGRLGPDFNDSIILNNGVTIPLSQPERVKDETGYTLEMNEYIVYDVSQIRMRYLVEVSN